MKLSIYIPSRGRSDIIMETTLPLLVSFANNGVPINICVREEDYKDYEFLHQNKDYNTKLRKVSSKMGIGEKRAYITNTLAKKDEADYILQIDDDYDALFEVYKKETHCWICGKEYVKRNDRQLDHDHETGEPRYICCISCNCKLK